MLCSIVVTGGQKTLNQQHQQHINSFAPIFPTKAITFRCSYPISNAEIHDSDAER